MNDPGTAARSRQVACVAQPEMEGRLAAILGRKGITVQPLSTEEAAGLPSSDRRRVIVDSGLFASIAEFSRYVHGCSASRAVLGLVPGADEEATALRHLVACGTVNLVDLCRLEDLEEELGARYELLAARTAFWRPVDQLTGLGNRTSMREDIARMLASPSRGESRAVFLMDLDHFKAVNDTWGHIAGDRVLREIGSALALSGRLGGDLYRYGGEEFAGIVLARERGEVVQLLERTREEIAGLVFRSEDGEQAFSVTASIGFVFIEDGMGLEDVYQRADQALYSAKAEGRNRVSCYDRCWDRAEEDPGRAALEHFENVTRVWTDRMSELIRSVGRKAMEESLRSAETDGLTGLYNRAYYDRRMARELLNASKSGAPLSIALLDVDDFHGVNMEYGYPTGDLALKTVADLARHHSRATDWVARYGGEEFIIVMPATTAAEAALVAERFRAALEAATVRGLGERSLRLTSTVGVASLDEIAAGDLSAASLVQVVSDRVVEGKRSGKNRVTGPQGVTAGKPPVPRAGRRVEVRKDLEVLVLDDKDHARTQVEAALERVGGFSWKTTWVDTVEALKALGDKGFDLAFIDFFLSKDHNYGTDALPFVKAGTLVGFSSKLAASSLIETEARSLGFAETAAIEKDKDRIENPALDSFLRGYRTRKER